MILGSSPASASFRGYTGSESRKEQLEDEGRQIEIASKHKSQFLANMSHELRTPLNAILGYTALILDNIYGEVPEKIRDVLTRVDKSGRHLLGLINDVLDLSKIEAGLLTLALTDYSMKEVVQTAVAEVESLAAEKKLALKVAAPPDLPRARGDELRITQVLLNLVGNAIKFTEAGEVRVEVAASDGAFLVSVADTGPGIAEADQRKIFEEFQQADGSSTREKGGASASLSPSGSSSCPEDGSGWSRASGKAPLSGSRCRFTSSVKRRRHEQAHSRDRGLIMRTPARILVADDNPDNVAIFQARLAAQGYEILTAGDGEEALAIARGKQPDLILLDVMMPRMDGIEVCRHLREDTSLPFMPIIMVTAKTGTQDVVAGLEAGDDEYLTKPVDQAALVARVNSMLRIKALHDKVQEQAAQLEAQAAQLGQWNRELESRVAEQVGQLERLSRLKRFVSPQLAERILTGGADDPLASHRREVTVVFLDLRGFTAFAETAEPEEVMGVLRDYHAAMGRLIQEYEGTLERFTGDGLMVFFNDPVVLANPTERAVRMALAMRDAAEALGRHWRKRGIELGLGIGIAQGYATIGFEDRVDYGAIGTVSNLAARLCNEARAGQILVSQRALCDVEDLVDAEPVGELTLKGFAKPLPATEIRRLRPPAHDAAPEPR